MSASTYVRAALRFGWIGCLGAVAGCGFQLEGVGELPVVMDKTYLDAAEPNSEFANSLRTALRMRGMELVRSRQDAEAVLMISEDDTGQRVLSVTARNIPREYEIYYLVTVSLRSGTQQLMDPESLVVTRNYTYDETQVLGKGAEERILRRSLADDLARQVLRRLESVATARPSSSS
jgi:LPS-assembly lipoprotein